MKKTATQQLSDQIVRLTRVYKKLQTNPALRVDTKTLSTAVEQLETEINLLEIKLEVLLAIPSLNLPRKG